MPQRKPFPPHAWFAPLLALLAFVLLAPAPTRSSPANPCRFESPDDLSGHGSASRTSELMPAADTDVVPQVKDLSSEDEEQDEADAPEGHRVGFRIPWCFRGVTVRQGHSPLPVLSYYPLRC